MLSELTAEWPIKPERLHVREHIWANCFENKNTNVNEHDRTNHIPTCFSLLTNTIVYSPLQYLLSTPSMLQIPVQLCTKWFLRTSCDLNKSQFILPSTKAIPSARIIAWRHIKVACFRSDDIFDNRGSLCPFCHNAFLSSHLLLFNSTNFDNPAFQSLFPNSACLISN